MSRRLLIGLATGLLGSSLIFLLLFVRIYNSQLEQERGNASAQVNRLLQASLENAMLKRDLFGLGEIVIRLGQQPGIHKVMILNQSRKVRFASANKDMEKQLDMQSLGCPDCGNELLNLPPMTAFMITVDGVEVQRSVNPIPNKVPCVVCHGTVKDNPINGILIVDYDASEIRESSLSGALMLSAAGVFVIFLALGGTWVFLRHSVIAPINVLNRASRAIAAGDLEARAPADLFSGDEIGDLCQSFNNMTERLARSLKDVREHEAYLQAIIDTVPDGVRVIDQDYKVVMANKAYCEQMGGDSTDVVGVPCYQAHGRSEPCVPSLITCPFHAQTEDGGQLKYFHRHVRSDGRSFYAEITAATLEAGVAGERQRFIVEAIRDIEQAVQYSQEQRLAELGQLATGVAHEIYNPLASVRLGLQSILRRSEQALDQDPNEVADYLGAVDGEVDKCIQVTRRLMDLSLPPSQTPQLVSFTTIIPEVISLLRYEAKKAGVELHIDLGDEDLRVLSTDSELRMLILNLVQNAFHAMPEGGRLSISGRVQDDEVIVVVEDTGVGISTEDILHIFDPFFSKRADRVAGTGLGLTISKAIVKRYDGELVADSSVGEGARFTITMPAAGREISER